MPREDVNEILNKYRSKIEDHVDEESEGQVTPEEIQNFSREYETFVFLQVLLVLQIPHQHDLQF